MIVAHPDDEIIWGEVLLSRKNIDWTVIIVTDEMNGRTLLAEQVALLNGHSLQVWKYADCSQCVPFRIGTRDTYFEVARDTYFEDALLSVVQSVQWDMVATHGETGEYGHPQHKELHEIVVKLVDHEKLFVFSPKFDQSLTRNSSLWRVYADDRPGLDDNYGQLTSVVVRFDEITDSLRKNSLAQCNANFPWDCALFDCENSRFDEGRRCGLKGERDTSSDSKSS